MKVDFETRSIKFDSGLEINGPIEVKRIPFSFNNIEILFLFINDGDSVFLYEDSAKYNELLKAVAGHPYEVGEKLREQQLELGIERDLWKQLVTAAIYKFKLAWIEYVRKTLVPIVSEYWSEINKENVILPEMTNNITETYNLIVSILPENIDNTKRKHMQKKSLKFVQNFRDLCGTDLKQTEVLFYKLENEVGNTKEDLNHTIKKIETAKIDVKYFLQENLIDVAIGHEAESILDECLSSIYKKRDALIEDRLINQYGPIDLLKKNLRDSINRLGFAELLELHKEYKDNEKVLFSKSRHEGLIGNPIYDKYITTYQLGAVLISDKLNKLNHNKTKTKYIPQDLLDEAVIFYYEATTVKDAYTARANEKYSQDKESGEKGEQKVEYALKWLDSSFVKIEKKSTNRLGEQCIYICNPAFIDEKQEYDHIIVSNKGIFNIETKNYTGKLVIDQYGNWIRKKNGEEEGIKNPLQQIRQHEKILKSFLPTTCNIFSIICVANDKAIIEGAENCPIPIIKSDMLVEYLENFNLNNSPMTDLQKKQCIETIYSYMV